MLRLLRVGCRNAANLLEGLRCYYNEDLARLHLNF